MLMMTVTTTMTSMMTKAIMRMTIMGKSTICLKLHGRGGHVVDDSNEERC